jgi:hypothetical protein
MVLAAYVAIAAGAEPMKAKPAALAQAKAEDSVTFPLEFSIIDPDSEEKLPPYIVVFEDGNDEDGNDVSGPLGRLEALRGASKMFPKSNDDPGLPVVLRGLRFNRKLDDRGRVESYTVELLGEFNLVRVAVDKNQMARFLAGETTTFTLKGQRNYGILAYVSSVKMTMQLRGKELFVLSESGDFSFREGFFTYTSATKKIESPAGRKYLYRGEIAKLPDLPSI